MAQSLLAGFIGDFPGASSLSPTDARAFALHCRASCLRGIRLLTWFLILGNLLCWPSDFFIFRNESAPLRALALWRGALLVVCGLALLLMRSERWAGSRGFLPTIYLLILIAGLTGGYCSSSMGGLDEPFYYAIYTFAGISTALFVPLRDRTFITYALTGSFLLGYFGMRPDYLHHPRFLSTLEVMAASNLGYILLGHVIYLLTRKSFFQGLALERKAEELAIAHAKSDRLLLNILPAPIASRLKEEIGPIADGFSDVTVLFADIVGFTTMSAQMPPQELVQLLNRVFSDFDKQVEKHGLEKIKTIGDAYMVAGGLPLPRADHAVAIADLALAIRTIVATYRTRDDEPLRIRIGIHSGPVVAGVIGAKKFIYDLWGDTVNTASRMESQGLPDEIQVSQHTHELLAPSFTLEPRGEINVKGIGPLSTWLLRGRRPEPSM